jgi:hypothetical protein
MDVGMLARLARDFPGFLRMPVTVETAATLVRARLERREDSFIRMAERMIYPHPRSPYLQLLRAAGCEFGDLKTLVDREGLDRALVRLADAGVYLTFDEFKGRREAVRGRQRFAFAEADFDNPWGRQHFEIRSGGTRGPGTVVKVPLEFVGEIAVSTALALHAHGLSACDHVIWLMGGVTPTLIYAKLGSAPLAWFYPLRPLSMAVQAGTRYLALLGRLARTRLAAPTFLDLMAPGELAVRLGTWLGQGRRVCVTTYASSAVRVAEAARARGMSLDGVSFITLGEPFTEAKRRVLETVGARPLVRFAFTEAGVIGYQCARPEGPDDLHCFTDRYGLIRRRRPAVGDAVPVDALLVTSLAPSAPKVLLNVESGDHGTIAQKPCGCELGAMGLNTHLSDIRSFEKLSGEGMTFVQTDLLGVLEDVLPARFGGAPTDYQVVEEEERGILRLALIISPRVGTIDETAARRAFVAALEKQGGLATTGARIWLRADTVVVRRQWPLATKAGKILPFQLVKVQLVKGSGGAHDG